MVTFPYSAVFLTLATSFQDPHTRTAQAEPLRSTGTQLVQTLLSGVIKQNRIRLRIIFNLFRGYDNKKNLKKQVLDAQLYMVCAALVKEMF